MDTRLKALVGVVIGGIAGTLLSWVYNGMLSAGAAAALGALAGGAIAWFSGRGKNSVQEAKILLRGEELKIFTKKIKTGDVSLRKEIIHEEKTITVPVTREELVITKIVYKADEPSPEKKEEVVRIPLNEEQLKVSKRKVILNRVSAYSHKIQETVHIDETLKKEKLVLATTGHPLVAEQDETEDASRILH